MDGLNGERNFEFLLWKTKRLSGALRRYSLGVKLMIATHKGYLQALKKIVEEPDSPDALSTFLKAEKLLREAVSASRVAGDALMLKQHELTFGRYEREKKEKEEKE